MTTERRGGALLEQQAVKRQLDAQPAERCLLGLLAGALPDGKDLDWKIADSARSEFGLRCGDQMLGNGVERIPGLVVDHGEVPGVIHVDPVDGPLQVHGQIVERTRLEMMFDLMNPPTGGAADRLAGGEGGNAVPRGFDLELDGGGRMYAETRHPGVEEPHQ